MDIDKKFDLIFQLGKQVCASYSGFSKHEIAYCQQKLNWMCIQQFLESIDPYEALIHFSLHPLIDVVSYFQLFVGCMIQFPDEDKNYRMINLLEIIDNQTELDDALSNSKIMRALLAIAANYVNSSPYRCYMLYYNAKRVLAHILKKYPKYFDLNIMHSHSKHKQLRFKKEEIDKFF